MIPLDELIQLVNEANAQRWPTGHPSLYPANAGRLEAQLEAEYQVSTRLAAYGTLAPGRSNHHVVAPLGGSWEGGVVEGDLHPVGWGATQGFPAFRPRPGGDVVPVQVLTSSALAGDWARLDQFEGKAYRRILVPVFATGGRTVLTVANLYAAA